MTAVFSAAALRMPHMASVAAPALRALGVLGEVRAPKPAVRWPSRPCGAEIGGIIAPACPGRLQGTESSDRFGGIARPGIGGGWDRQDQAQLAGGGPLRGR